MDPQKQYEAFLRLSAEVTGYSRTDLLGTGVGHLYLETFSEIVGDDILNELLTRSNQIWKSHKDEAKKEEAIRHTLLSNDKFGPLVRNLIKLWYMGQWDELPADWRERYGTSINDVNKIISGDSFKEGLMWDAIGAHPPAAKQPGFGTWSSPPAPPDFD